MRRALAVVTMLILGCPGSPAKAADEVDQLLDIGGPRFEPLATAPDEAVFLHAKVLTLTRESLTSGWVGNHQCHRRFAAVPALDVVFPAGAVDAIEILEADGIGQAWSDDQGVYSRHVTPDSRLCFRSRNRLLVRDVGGGGYHMLVGPFFYRFLDGYFPMRMDLTVRYPAALLRSRRVTPDGPPDVEVRHGPGEIRVTSVFRGELWVEFWFEPIDG